MKGKRARKRRAKLTAIAFLFLEELREMARREPRPKKELDRK
jgi:hypothetical protein